MNKPFQFLLLKLFLALWAYALALWLDRSISMRRLSIVGAWVGTFATVYIVFAGRPCVTSVVAAIAGASIDVLPHPTVHSASVVEILWLAMFAIKGIRAILRFGPHRVALVLLVQ